MFQFDLLKRFSNVQNGLFIERVKLPSQGFIENRKERQARIRKQKWAEFKTSIESQGDGYSYDFRNVKKHKPKRIYGLTLW